MIFIIIKSEFKNFIWRIILPQTSTKNFFEKYVEYKFTASMEEELDDISNGKIDWETVLNKFWEQFSNNIDDIMENITVSNVIDTLEQDIHDYIFKNIRRSYCNSTNLLPNHSYVDQLRVYFPKIWLLYVNIFSILRIYSIVVIIIKININLFFKLTYFT